MRMGRETCPSDQIHKSMLSIHLFKEFGLSSYNASGPESRAGESEMENWSPFLLSQRKADKDHNSVKCRAIQKYRMLAMGGHSSRL